MTKQQFVDKLKSTQKDAEDLFQKSIQEIGPENTFIECFGWGGFMKFHLTQIVLERLKKPLLKPNITDMVKSKMSYDRMEKEFENMAQEKLLEVMIWALEEPIKK